MCSVLHLDYESRSEVDLLKQGAYIYAADQSTDIICLGWAFDDDTPDIWKPGEPFPECIRDHLNANKPRSIHAHNAQFEHLITRHVLPRYVDFRQPDIDAYYCSAAQARARALPGALDDLGGCLGLRVQKDKRGKELIKLLCIPQYDDNGDRSFNHDPDLLDEMYSYCRQDVRVERLAAQMTPPLTETEHDDWVVSEIVNDAGLRVDTKFAAAAADYADEEVAEISAEISIVTGGKITSPKQYQRIKDYMAPCMDANDAIRKAMTVVRTDRRTGEEARKISFDKDARIKLKALEENQPGTLPEDILELIELVDEAGRSSVSKYTNMVQRAGPDDRVRGAYIFSGAGQTGRFSSVGLQVHNMPRNCAADPDNIRDRVLRHETLDTVMDTLSSMLRPSIIAAPGHQFVCGDWSAIEARVLPWLSASNGGSKVLDVFVASDRDPSLPDVYMSAAAGLYAIDARDVDRDQRQIGKVIILSSGYQGGYRAFQAMARAYKVVVSDEIAGDIIRNWRAENPWAAQFWRDLDRAAKDAVRYPGEAFQVGRLTYCRPDDTAPLYCQLPSGRVLSYPNPRLEEVEGPYGTEYELTAIKAQWKPKRGETEWGRITLYGGQLAENSCQATAACILRHAMGLALDDGWPLVGTTHDELLLEVFDNEVDAALEGLHAIMLDLPSWASGLHMACNLWAGERYKK